MKDSSLSFANAFSLFLGWAYGSIAGLTLAESWVLIVIGITGWVLLYIEERKQER